MPISQTNLIKLQEVEVGPFNEGLPLNPGGLQKIIPNSSLPQVFKDDFVGSKGASDQKIILEEKSPTFWDKFTSWLTQNELDPKVSSMPATQAETVKKAEPISPIPVLEAPEKMPSELQTATLPPVISKKTSRQTFSPNEVMEAVSLMSQHTVDEVMAIVLKGQLELEKENAEVAENTLTKYQNIKKLKQKVLEEVRDAIAKDEKILSYCKSAQNVALVASVVCSIVAGAVSFGILTAPVFGLIASTGPIAAAFLTGVSSGGKAYSQRRLNEDKATHDTYSHQETMTDNRLEEARERLMGVAEADQVFKERLVQLLKRSAKMRQIILQQ